MQNKIIPFFLVSGLFISACPFTQLNAIRNLGNTTMDYAHIVHQVKHAVDDAHEGKFFWDRATQSWSIYRL